MTSSGIYVRIGTCIIYFYYFKTEFHTVVKAILELPALASGMLGL